MVKIFQVKQRKRNLKYKYQSSRRSSYLCESNDASGGVCEDVDVVLNTGGVRNGLDTPVVFRPSSFAFNVLLFGVLRHVLLLLFVAVFNDLFSTTRRSSSLSESEENTPWEWVCCRAATAAAARGAPLGADPKIKDWGNHTLNYHYHIIFYICV